MQNSIIAGEHNNLINYEERLNILNKEITDPKQSLGANLLEHRQQLEDIYIRIKASKETHVDTEKIVNLFNKVAENLNTKLNPSNQVQMIQKSDFQQNVSPREKEFTKLLTPRILGHVVGDSFLMDMVSNSGEPLEGNQFSTSLEFLTSALNYLPEKYAQEFPDSLKDQIPQLCKQFQQAAEWAKATEKLPESLSIEDYNDLLPELNKLSSRLNDTINSLKMNESFLFPWGWINKAAASGHAILVEFVKTKDGMVLKVYNTGGGLDFHEIANDATRLYGNTVKEYRVPHDKLDVEFLGSLLEPRLLGRSDSVMSSNKPYEALDLYSLLAPYEVQSEEAQRLTNKMRKMQQSGTCSMRCLFAYIDEKTDAQKAFKNILSREVIKQSLEIAKGNKNHPARKIIGKAIPNLFRHLGKEVKTLPDDKKKNLLLELENYQKLYQQYFPESLSENDPFLIEDIKPQRHLAEEVKKQAEDALKKITIAENIQKAALKPAMSIPSVNLDSPLNGATLNAELEKFITFCEKYEGDCSILSNDILCRLGRIFTNPAFESQREKLLESFDADPNCCYEIIGQIGTLSKLGFKKSNNPISFQRSLALHSAIAATWTLSSFYSTQAHFKDFALPNRYLNFYMQGPLQGGVGALIAGKEMEDDFRHLAEFFSKDYKNNKPQKPIVFDFKFGDKLPDADFNHIKMIYNDFRDDSTNKDKFDEFIEKADMEYKSQEAHQVTLENWRILYLFKNGPLPREYRLVRNLIQLCKAESPFIDEKHFGPNNLPYDQAVSIPEIFCPSHGTVPYPRPEDPEYMPPDFQYVNYNKNIESGNYWGLEVPDYFRATFSEGQNQIFEFMSPRTGNKQSLFKSTNPVGVGVIDKAHSEMVESLSIKSASIGFQYRMLIDVYKKNLFNLSKPEHQANVSIVMTEAFALSRALQHSSKIGWELRNFLDEALGYFSALTPEILQNKDKAATIAFLQTQKAYLFSLMKEHKIARAEDGLEETRQAIQECLKNPDFNLAPKKKNYCLLMLIALLAKPLLQIPKPIR